MVKSLCRFAVITGLTFLSSGMPTMAQIVNGVDFTTSFPFYAGNAKMPAGAYTISEAPGEDDSVLLIQSKDGSHSAFLDVTPTQATDPHPRTDITFNKYGTSEYLSQVWVAGQSYGMKVVSTKVEQKAASNAAAAPHSVPAKAR